MITIMTNFEKENAINYLISKGVNFEKDVFTLSNATETLLHNTAKNCRFRPKPNNSCLSAVLHARFYIYLQRYYLKHKDLFV